MGENLARATRSANLISAILKGIDPALVNEMHTAVDEAVEDAKRRAPVRTGKLRNSIYGRVIVHKHGVEGQIVSPAPSGKFVEIGTSDTRPHPFMRPAANRARRQMPDHVKKAVKISISKARY